MSGKTLSTLQYFWILFFFLSLLYLSLSFISTLPGASFGVKRW